MCAPLEVSVTSSVIMGNSLEALKKCNISQALMQQFPFLKENPQKNKKKEKKRKKIKVVPMAFLSVSQGEMMQHGRLAPQKCI